MNPAFSFVLSRPHQISPKSLKMGL